MKLKCWYLLDHFPSNLGTQKDGNHKIPKDDKCIGELGYIKSIEDYYKEDLIVTTNYFSNKEINYLVIVSINKHSLYENCGTFDVFAMANLTIIDFSVEIKNKEYELKLGILTDVNDLDKLLNDKYCLEEIKYCFNTFHDCKMDKEKIIASYAKSHYDYKTSRDLNNAAIDVFE